MPDAGDIRFYIDTEGKFTVVTGDGPDNNYGAPNSEKASYFKRRGQKCAVHKYHWPPITVVDDHHIFPKEYGGPDIAANKVAVCPNGHRNIHEYILAALHHYGDQVKVTKKEKYYADLGLQQIINRPMPPGTT